MVAPHETPQNLDQKPAFPSIEPTHDAEIHHDDHPIGIDEQIAPVQIGMK